MSEKLTPAPGAKSSASSGVSAKSQPSNVFGWSDRFVQRHIGPNAAEVQEMLQSCGFSSLDSLIDAAVPSGIRLKRPLNLPASRSEHGLLSELKTMAAKNRVFRSFIGTGYSDCITPPVIQRSILVNPGWYTQYTPYQAEIAQGRLEALLNFQTMIVDLTGMEISNASLLDEATAAAEAISMAHAIKADEPRKSVFVSEKCHPQTIEVVRTRAEALGLVIVVGNHHSIEEPGRFFAALVQYPATDGTIFDYRALAELIHKQDGLLIVAADLLSLTVLAPPGDFGADIVVGSSQRFGIPLGYGGPHAAFLSTRDEFKRQMPGRVVGVSKDARGRPALRLALQTREQHIRREKATSNICTAQVLLAVIASMYAVYHGPDGLRKIAQRIHLLTGILARGLRKLGYEISQEIFFDTIAVSLGQRRSKDIMALAEKAEINVRAFDAQTVGISLDETTSLEDLQHLLAIFNGGREVAFDLEQLADKEAKFDAPFGRTSPFLTHPVFNKYHSETEMLRYIKRLESRDLSLTTSMIPLGSCTMKLNAAAEMFPITWPEFSKLHPFVPTWQAEGYRKMFQQLEEWLAEITGFKAVSLQPNAGSQGEYAGLLVIRRFHESRGAKHRTVCLIPTSAHGTNPASAVMAGMQVVAVACEADGDISLSDLKAKAQAHEKELAALMVTYPSTHGVFEETIGEICQIVHAHGGQVYMDGANMNAQVGLCRPGDIGADVCHLNLHKTFCIPHGGGGPGMGPICVAAHLAPFLPRHPLITTGGKDGIGPVSAAPWGSASILAIPWVYIRLMGPDGQAEASKIAILNANYIARRLEKSFPVLFKGHGDLVAHECILDFRQFKTVTVEDVAKRLMDYGFHAPTVSWPVPGTMMVEPTESESKEELDRFCDALIAIHQEIMAVENGAADPKDNLLKNAPHPAESVSADVWNHPYSREQAAYPAKWLREHKFWPAVGRIDNVWGDRHPVCSCTGMEEFTP